MKILLAEDDTSISFITKTCLEKIGGHDVTVVDDGQKALTSANAETFDLLILDAMMPKKNGLLVATEYRANHQGQTPIIFLSAKNEEKEILKYQEIGCGFIAKPFDPMKICGQIESLYKTLKKAG